MKSEQLEIVNENLTIEKYRNDKTIHDAMTGFSERMRKLEMKYP